MIFQVPDSRLCEKNEGTRHPRSDGRVILSVLKTNPGQGPELFELSELHLLQGNGLKDKTSWASEGANSLFSAKMPNNRLTF